ncbi:hypothetical protein ACTMU2_30765 [Cupriavidus basilensis]
MASITVYALGICIAFTAALLGHEVIGRSASGIDMIAPVARSLRPEMKLSGVPRAGSYAAVVPAPPAGHGRTP